MANIRAPSSLICRAAGSQGLVHQNLRGRTDILADDTSTPSPLNERFCVASICLHNSNKINLESHQYIMVKHDSLRGSSSNISLRSSAQEEAARHRIAELEAQVAALTAQALKQPDSRIPPTIPCGDSDQFDRGIQAIVSQPVYKQQIRTLWDERQESERRLRNLHHASAMKEQSSFTEQRSSLFEGFSNGKRQTSEAAGQEHSLKSPSAYTQPFCDFLTENPTIWHAVSYFEQKLVKAGFKKVCATSHGVLISNDCSCPNDKPGMTSSRLVGNTSSLEMEVP